MGASSPQTHHRVVPKNSCGTAAKSLKFEALWQEKRCLVEMFIKTTGDTFSTKHLHLERPG